LFVVVVQHNINNEGVKNNLPPMTHAEDDSNTPNHPSN
jgi:hypothetical protein